MRRLSFLLAGGALWLFLTAVPALADGGPHLTSVNSGTSTLTADSCAGCHRAHTSQSQYLLKAASEELLCLSCHGTGGTLATVNVELGIQYAPNGDGTRDTGTVLGALRNGGFLEARIDAGNPSRLSYPRGYEDSPFNTVFAISTKPKVGVGASEPVRSAHIDLADAPSNGIADTHTLWGKGSSGLGTGQVSLTCVECHNPHGNGQYRILRPVPGVEADPLGQPIPVAVKATYANQDTIVTDGQHGLTVSDKVTLTGVGGLANGDYFVTAVTNGFTFKVGTTVGVSLTTLTDTTNAGTVIRSEVAVADVNPDPEGNGSFPTKNYTILQTKGSQGVDSTYLLYARDVLAARAGNGVAQNQPAVTINNAVSVSGTVYLQTVAAHGLAVGDLVTITGTPGGVAAGTYTVGAVGSSGSVYDRFTLIGQTPTAGVTTGTVARNGIPGNYTATGGDYFRRIVPWDPSALNPGCSNTIFSSTNSAYCGTANDAPNGRPATITSGPSTLIGQQAFLDQMSTWCSQCHTRYYSNSNENVAGAEPISAISDRPIGRTATTGEIYPMYYSPKSTQYGGPSYGDKVTFAGMADTALNSGEWYVIETGSTSGRSWFKVTAEANGLGGAAFTPTAGGASPYDTSIGTFTRTYQSSNSSWGYPRADATYMYQHSTASNRACVVCHVAHGSNAQMTGANSLAVTYPDGTTTSTSSRLLKVDNRGTCQMCHDPTGTVAEGTYLPTGYTPQIP